LFVLNSPFVEKQAESLAKRLPADATTAKKIEFCYQRLFGRIPTTNEVDVGVQYLGDADVKRWTSYLHALLSLNEFLYVD